MEPLSVHTDRLTARNALRDIGGLAGLTLETKNDRNFMQALVQNKRYSDRLRNIVLKAEPGMALSPGGSPATWGNTYDNMWNEVLPYPVYAGVFDAARPFFVFLPIKSKMPIVDGAVLAYIVDEGAAKTISEFDFSNGGALDPLKAVVIVVASVDLIKFGGVMAENAFATGLVNAIRNATDKKLLDDLIAATTPETASGDVLNDVDTLLEGMAIGDNARLFLTVTPTEAKGLAFQRSTTGGRAFPEMTVNGGNIGGITVVVSDSLDAGKAVLFDATQIAADPGTVVMDASSNATLDMAGGNSPTFDLFGKNCRALRAERTFGFRVLRSTAVTSLTGVSYSGESPA